MLYVEHLPAFKAPPCGVTTSKLLCMSYWSSFRMGKIDLNNQVFFVKLKAVDNSDALHNKRRSFLAS